MENEAVKKYLELLNPFVLPNYIDELKNLKIDNMYGSDFFLTCDKTKDELNAIWLVADALRHLRENNISTKVFESGLGVGIYKAPSVKTRFSFDSACNLLGLSPQTVEEKDSKLSYGEMAGETANMISFMSDVVGVRDHKYIGKGNTYMHKVADTLGQGFKEGLLEQKPTLINLQCDIDHPTQTMSDMLHLVNIYRGLENLRGKKVVMSWAYSPTYGKSLSVSQGIIGLMTRFGMDVVLAHPPGYDIMPEVEVMAENNVKINGGSFSKTHSMKEAFNEADIIYAKNWTPFSVLEKKTKLYDDSNFIDLRKLEKELQEENSYHKNWSITADAMKNTKEALYMHCLPVDITGVTCDHGEIDAATFEKYRKFLYKQASYKSYVIAAMILLAKFKNVPTLLERLDNDNKQRKLKIR